MTDLPVSSSARSALDVALETIREVGALVRGRFYSAKEIAYKGPSNLVTDVDMEAEAFIKGALSREFPRMGFLGEESGAAGSDDGFRWIVDPVDGTRNYAAGVPHFAISMALADGPAVLLGVTYDPMRDELFHAVRGHGAFLNGAPISASKRTAVADTLVGFDMSGADVRAACALTLVQGLWPGVQSLRVMGSATLGLAYAAAGRVDIFFHHTLAPWDVAAGLVLLDEAGGQMVDRRSGGPATLRSTGVVASSPELLAEFLRLTQGEEWYTVE